MNIHFYLHFIVFINLLGAILVIECGLSWLLYAPNTGFIILDQFSVFFNFMFFIILLNLFFIVLLKLSTNLRRSTTSRTRRMITCHKMGKTLCLSSGPADSDLITLAKRHAWNPTTILPLLVRVVMMVQDRWRITYMTLRKTTRTTSTAWSKRLWKLLARPSSVRRALRRELLLLVRHCLDLHSKGKSLCPC